MNKTCDHEIVLHGDNEADYAYCGLPTGHAGMHGEWVL